MPRPDGDHRAGFVTFSDKITDVRVADSVLAATVAHEIRVSDYPPSSGPVARAIGIRVNCLVEVYVNFFDPIEESADPTGSVQTTAIDLAHAMMDKISTLS